MLYCCCFFLENQEALHECLGIACRLGIWALSNTCRKKEMSYIVNAFNNSVPIVYICASKHTLQLHLILIKQLGI